jgi:hypothetical protein
VKQYKEIIRARFPGESEAIYMVAEVNMETEIIIIDPGQTSERKFQSLSEFAAFLNKLTVEFTVPA